MTPYQIYQTLDHERFAEWFFSKYPSKTLLYCQPGIGKIKHHGDSFVFDPAGTDAAIIYTGDDLIAWYSNSPTRLYTHAGSCRDVNLTGLHEAIIYQQPFHAHDSVLSWLTDLCRGGVPIRADVWSDYKALSEIRVSTDDMQRRVEAEMNKLAVVPRVKVVK